MPERVRIARKSRMLSGTSATQQDSVRETKRIAGRSIIEISKIVPHRIPLLVVPRSTSFDLVVEPPRIPMLSGIVHVVVGIYPGRMRRDSSAGGHRHVSFVVTSWGQRPDKIIGILLQSHWVDEKQGRVADVSVKIGAPKETYRVFTNKSSCGGIVVSGAVVRRTGFKVIIRKRPVSPGSLTHLAPG